MSTRAYSHIKRVQPDLVVLCVHFDNMDALQVLSMLKLDDDTRTIPVLTYTAGYEVQDLAPGVLLRLLHLAEPGVEERGGLVGGLQ